MLLNSVVLILREVLEAAMLISVLLALSLKLQCGLRWFWWSAPLAMLGTLIAASNLDTITDALDGAGQEVVNAVLQILVYCLSVGVVWLSAGTYRSRIQSRALATFMAIAVACAMIREGSEIVVYISGFAAVEEYRSAVYAGSVIGAGIGLSSGVLMYSALRALRDDLVIKACLVLICIIGAGMVMQSTILLEQVDWLPSAPALWDSSAIISEQSIAGELMYAVFGYESTPGSLQVMIYAASIAIMLVTYFLARALRSPEYVE